jgi:hypothetical protein
MPHDAHNLRWLYGLVIDPYPLTLRRADGNAVTEWIQGSDWSSTLDLSGQFRRATRLETTREYFVLGYTHILPKGLDHILFVLGLFLLSPRLKTMLLQVTAFTVAHSITLGLSIYGIVSLPSRIVEPLIALSIAYVAIENLLTRELKPWRLVLVFTFGLLHGLGFAGAVTFPNGTPILSALIGFNIGIELGQAMIIAVVFPLLLAVRRFQWAGFAQAAAGSAAAAMGLFWLSQRVLGG